MGGRVLLLLDLLAVILQINALESLPCCSSQPRKGDVQQRKGRLPAPAPSFPLDLHFLLPRLLSFRPLMSI